MSRTTEPMEEGELLIVDDQQAVRDVLRRILTTEGYRCRTVNSVASARTAIDELTPDLVLCDIDMPGESGLTLVRHLHETRPEVAVLMVTAFDDRQVAEQAMDDGAFGYVIKPFERNEILINVSAALRRCREARKVRSTIGTLETEVATRTRDLQHSLRDLEALAVALDRSNEHALRRLACAAELRDPETAQHLERMSRYSKVLGEAAGLDADQAELLRLASPMHDIGKIGIPDYVLMKDGPFTPADRKIMETHALIGFELLTGSSSPLLEMAASVALNHHEKVDGTGYPNQRRADAIPLEGRIVAIADVFDALTSERRYKRAMSVDEALEIMLGERGKHFDADLLDLFLLRIDDIVGIQRAWADQVVGAV